MTMFSFRVESEEAEHGQVVTFRNLLDRGPQVRVQLASGVDIAG